MRSRARPATLAGAAAVLVATVGVVVARAALAPDPPARRRATPAEASALAGEISSAEPGWLVETDRAFPRDRWSARDDFHGREFRAVVTKAREAGVPVEDVLRAIDDDIHHASAASAASAGDPRSARAVPCKPRPIYD
jgi:hypothetical protein